jgi:hypothetical protein
MNADQTTELKTLAILRNSELTTFTEGMQKADIRIANIKARLAFGSWLSDPRSSAFISGKLFLFPLPDHGRCRRSHAITAIF